MRNSWLEEFWRLAFILVIGVLLGLVVGHIWAALAVVLCAYALRNLYNLQRFIRWLNDPSGEDPPIQLGIWGDIYAKIQRMRHKARQRERRLGQILAQYQASAAALPDAAIALGPAGEIRWFNDAAKSWIGLRSPQDLGRPLVNLFRAPQLARYLSEGDYSKPLELTAPGDRLRLLAVRVTAYGDGERLLLAQDVTERLRTEQIRKDFVGNVSHELRTPLTVISGFVENMQADDDSVPVQWRKPLDLIAGQAERMRQIVEDLLLLARLESASVEAPRDPVDPAEMLESIARDGRSLATEKQKIQVSIESDAWLLGDGGLLRSAVTNLMVNAIHHTPDGGQITLALQETPEGLSILVEDTGEGIAAEHIPRLTERFYRVDAGRSRERGGTGLGLAIVKHALQKHGAKLKIASRVGEGSRFSCIFPADRRIPAP